EAESSFDARCFGITETRRKVDALALQLLDDVQARWDHWEDHTRPLSTSTARYSGTSVRRRTFSMHLQNIREVHRKTKLSADSGARNVLPSQHPEFESQPFVNFVLTADESLQLTSSQALLVSNPSINLAS